VGKWVGCKKNKKNYNMHQTAFFAPSANVISEKNAAEATELDGIKLREN